MREDTDIYRKEQQSGSEGSGGNAWSRGSRCRK